MFDSFYHMTFNYFEIIFWREKGFVICVTLKRYFITFPKICKPLVVVDFYARRYITSR